MKSDCLLNDAIAIASDEHSGQVDKGGAPYIFHPLHVMNAVREKYGHGDIELLAIAVLHDVVEDGCMMYGELRSIFGNRVTYGIECLTKHTNESDSGYLNRIKNNPDAVKVKIEDLKHNMDLTRLKTVTDDDKKRYEKYCSMLEELEGK